MAKRFRFNLDAVLRYRQIMEDQKRRDFAEANRLLDEERLRREDILRERSDMQDEIVRSFSEHSPFQTIVTSYHMVGKLEQAAHESMNRQRQLEAERERRRQLLVSARQETRMMETLKDRRREEFTKEQDREEQALLDDLSIQAKARRNRESKHEAGGNAQGEGR